MVVEVWLRVKSIDRQVVFGFGCVSFGVCPMSGKGCELQVRVDDEFVGDDGSLFRAVGMLDGVRFLSGGRGCLHRPQCILVAECYFWWL